MEDYTANGKIVPMPGISFGNQHKPLSPGEASKLFRLTCQVSSFFIVGAKALSENFTKERRGQG